MSLEKLIFVAFAIYRIFLFPVISGTSGLADFTWTIVFVNLPHCLNCTCMWFRLGGVSSAGHYVSVRSCNVQKFSRNQSTPIFFTTPSHAHRVKTIYVISQWAWLEVWHQRNHTLIPDLINNRPRWPLATNGKRISKENNRSYSKTQLICFVLS